MGEIFNSAKTVASRILFVDNNREKEKEGLNRVYDNNIEFENHIENNLDNTFENNLESNMDDYLIDVINKGIKYKYQ